MSLCANFFGCNPENQKLYAQDQDLIYRVCLDCGIIWRNEESFHLEKSYDQEYFHSKSYQKNRGHKIKKSGWLLDMAQSIRPDLSSILEIGCSLGNTLQAAKFRGMDHLGIDVSEFAVNYCQNKGLNASTESLSQLITQERTYHLIFMQHVLEHFKNPFEVLQQCYQLLDEHGLVVILIPNARYYRAEKLRERHKFYSQRGVGLEHFVYFDYNNLERALNKTGFNMVQKNYPLGIIEADNLPFYFNRIGRRFLSLFSLDQELVVVGQKMNQGSE